MYKFFKNIYIVNICLKDNLENSIPLILKLKQNQTFLISKYIRIARMFGEKKLSYILKELNEIDRFNAFIWYSIFYMKIYDTKKGWEYFYKAKNLFPNHQIVLLLYENYKKGILGGL